MARAIINQVFLISMTKCFRDLPIFVINAETLLRSLSRIVSTTEDCMCFMNLNRWLRYNVDTTWLSLEKLFWKLCPENHSFFLPRYTMEPFVLPRYPREWKHFTIIMIAKPQKYRNDPNSYRSLSLINILCVRLFLPIGACV